MNNFAAYLTPEQLLTRGHKRYTLEQLRALAERPANTCLNCDEKEWKIVGTGLCFSCQTGESDASDDFEIG